MRAGGDDEALQRSSSRKPTGRQNWGSGVETLDEVLVRPCRRRRSASVSPAPPLRIALSADEQDARAHRRFTLIRDKPQPDRRSRTDAPAPSDRCGATIVSIASSDTAPSTCVVESIKDPPGGYFPAIAGVESAEHDQREDRASHRLATMPLILGSREQGGARSQVRRGDSDRSRTSPQLGGIRVAGRPRPEQILRSIQRTAASRLVQKRPRLMTCDAAGVGVSDVPI